MSINRYVRGMSLAMKKLLLSYSSLSWNYQQRIDFCRDRLQPGDAGAGDPSSVGPDAETPPGLKPGRLERAARSYPQYRKIQFPKVPNCVRTDGQHLFAKGRNTNENRKVPGCVLRNRTGCGQCWRLGGGCDSGPTVERRKRCGSRQLADGRKTYNSSRFSPLNEINAGNVAGLRLAFAAPYRRDRALGLRRRRGRRDAAGRQWLPLSCRTRGARPTSSTCRTARQAKLVWICDTGINKDATSGLLLANRGLALSGKNVITPLERRPRGRLRRDNGRGRSGKSRSARTRAKASSLAPLVIGDKMLVGQSYGDWATRGFDCGAQG